ncbi:MAG: capsular polysaccharide synthesis protein [Prevotella sp.]|nr:capsular polysaccharide synthesis protein [Prevotella sp.]
MNIINKILDKWPGIKLDYAQKRHFFGVTQSAYCSIAKYLGRMGKAKHDAVLKIVKDNISGTIKYYSDLKCEVKEPISADCPIWVMWWQGEGNMPPIVKRCVASIRNHCGQHPVNVLSRSNYSDYIQLPSSIQQKLENNGWIPCLSDLIRFGLLKEHGGIWLDATLLTTKPIGHFEQSLYSIRHEVGNPRFVLNGDKWSTFMFASTKGHPVPCFIYDALIEYFTKNDYLIDYWLIDYTIATMYLENKGLAEYIDNLPLDNPTCLALLLERDMPYSEKRLNEIFAANRFNKLDWRLPVRKGTMLKEALK